LVEMLHDKEDASTDQKKYLKYLKNLIRETGFAFLGGGRSL